MTLIKKISRKEFEEMYNSMTVKRMSRILGVSSTTIYSVIRDMKIKKKGKKQVWRKLIVEE